MFNALEKGRNTIEKRSNFYFIHLAIFNALWSINAFIVDGKYGVIFVFVFR